MMCRKARIQITRPTTPPIAARESELFRFRKIVDVTLNESRFTWSSKISENVFYQLVNGGLGGMVSVLHTALTSRYLGVSQFGAFSLVLAHVLLFYGFTSWGADVIAVRRMAQEPERQTEWLSSLVTLRMIFALISYVACIGALWVVRYDLAVVHAIAIYSFIILFAPFESFIVVYQVNLRTGAAVLTTLGVQIGMFLSTLLAMHLKAGFQVLIWIAAISTVLRLVGLCVYLRDHLTVKAEWCREKWSLLLQGGVPLALASLCTSMVGRFSLFLLSQTHSMQSVGEFAAPYRLIFFLMFIPESVMVPIYPLFCRSLETDRATVLRLFQKVTNLLTLISMPLCILGMFLSEFIMMHFFGPDFVVSTKTFQFLLLDLMCVCMILPSGSMMIAAGKERVSLAFNVGASIVSYGVIFLLVPRLGSIGAALALCVMHMLLMISSWAYLLRLKIVCDWRTLRAGLYSALSMVGVIFLLGSSLRMPALFAGVGTYVLVLGWFLGWFRTPVELEIV